LQGQVPVLVERCEEGHAVATHPGHVPREHLHRQTKPVAVTAVYTTSQHPLLAKVGTSFAGLGDRSVGLTATESLNS
jgi:hypothetical protein